MPGTNPTHLRQAKLWSTAKPTLEQWKANVERPRTVLRGLHPRCCMQPTLRCTLPGHRMPDPAIALTPATALGETVTLGLFQRVA